MKVLFDHQIFERQKFGGISRYFFELLKFFRQSGKPLCDLSIRYSENEYLKNVSVCNTIEPFPEKVNHRLNFFWGLKFKGKERLYDLKNRFLPDPPTVNPFQYNKNETIKKLKEGDFDLFHPTYYDDYFLDFIGNKPFVITVYDMIHQIFPEYFIGTNHVDKTQKLLRRANRVIAISENTKKDLVSIFDIDEEKIDVVYLANSISKPTKGMEQKFNKPLPHKYLLFVGNRIEYKNFYFFLQSISSLLVSDKNLFLVITGNGLTPAEETFIYKLGIADKICHFFADETQLPVLYSNASAFVFPSLYEGFGLPVLEAFHCDCPVICSGASSLLEVGGEAAIYFNPKDARSISTAIQWVLDDPSIRFDLREKGKKQLEKFSWDKAGCETLKIYEDVLKTV